MKERRTFTVFGKYGYIYDLLSIEESYLLSDAVIRYGLFGEEADFTEYPSLNAYFQTMKADIKYSIESRANGKIGGRSKKD